MALNKFEVDTDELGLRLRSALIDSAEPHIQEALQEVEKEMRRTVLNWASGVIENHYRIERVQNELVIRLNLGGKDNHG